MSEETTVDQDASAADWAAAMQEQTTNTPNSLHDSGGDLVPAEGSGNLDLILDIPVRISLEVGNTQISIRQLVKLTRGSVVELDRLAGDPLDVLVNGTLVAHGEVVVLNDKFGIRLTDVVSPSERIKQLR